MRKAWIVVAVVALVVLVALAVAVARIKVTHASIQGLAPTDPRAHVRLVKVTFPCLSVFIW